MNENFQMRKIIVVLWLNPEMDTLYLHLINYLLVWIAKGFCAP